MKMNILVGAAALLVMVLMTVQAVATAGQATVSGTVTDVHGDPVPGANVTLIDDSVVNGNFHGLGSTTSDASGNFGFRDVPLAGSSYVKVLVSFTHNGTTYTISEPDMQWYDASPGLVNFNLNDTRLYRYPPSDYGYVWGVVLDSTTNGRALTGTVYLVNNTTTLTAETSSNGGYQIKAATGEYEIYAVHVSGDNQSVSKRTKITITSSYTLQESAPLALIADMVTLAPSPTPVPAGNKFIARGTVTDLQGNPVAGASVRLIDDSFRTLGTATTDANGNFRLVDLDAGSSGLVKAEVSYVRAGQTYKTSQENVRWMDASSGAVNFDPADTRLYNYPPGNHGYVWGVVLDNLTDGRVMESVVYLRNNTELLTADTSVESMGGFRFEVTPGDYEIYAVHGSGDNRLVSNRTTIHVYQSNDLLLSAPITLVVDRQDTGRPVAVLPLAAALAFGLVMIIAGRAILGRRDQ
jgi:hypothetical protein